MKISSAKFIKKAAAVMLAVLFIISVLPASGRQTEAASTTFGKVNFLQEDMRWRNLQYGSSTLLDSGSGILSLVNAVYNCIEKFLEPKDIADWAYGENLFNKGQTPGINDRSIFSKAAAKYGEDFGFKLSSSGWGTSASSELKDHVRNYGTAIVHVPGHFITLVDYNASEDKFYVFDSAPGTGVEVNFAQRSGLTTADGDWKTSAELATGKLNVDYYWLIQPKNTDTMPNPNDFEYPQRQLYYNSSSVMTGDDVKWVQSILKRLGYTVDVDGKFGPATKAVFVQFQTDYGLDADGYCGPMSCAKLKEEWEKIDPTFGVYSFTFDANGGTMGPDTAFNTKYGKDFTVLNTVTVKKGSTFAGWYVKRNADSKFVVAEGYWSTESEIAQNGYHLQVYANGKKLNFNNSWTKEYDGVSTYTFYAIWTELPTYTVKFDANGGTDAPVDQIKIQDEALRLTNDAPKRESYFFRGWSTAPDAQKIDYYAGTLYEQNADITLYAVWGKNIILGDVNGDGEIDSMDAVEISRYDVGFRDFDADQFFAADVNGDGEADSSDAVMILKYDAGIIDAI